MTDRQRQQDESRSVRDDPVVEEVRTIRQRLWEQSGRDIRRFIEQSRQSAERRRDEGQRRTRDAG